ncbi:uncharacterized protein LOC118203493 [Stegodyphus dumicola]|uniref:uncharacterized protein LOC118203493 n=1 Tax=Stegodyphus dumicola TaxID=202533 RepID=UPI0015AE535D|nr:uncharacterized protein LOC118203493 [Stegodyphus dumicola]
MMNREMCLSIFRVFCIVFIIYSSIRLYFYIRDSSATTSDEEPNAAFQNFQLQSRYQPCNVQQTFKPKMENISEDELQPTLVHSATPIQIDQSSALSNDRSSPTMGQQQQNLNPETSPSSESVQTLKPPRKYRILKLIL